MEIQKLNFDETPERIGDEKVDCIWIRLVDRPTPSPLKSRALQWLDWKLLGQISRFVKEGETATTFLPTMRQLSIPYIALQPAKENDWKRVVENCRGLKLSRILFFCEDRGQMTTVEQAFRQQNSSDFPQWVALASPPSAEASG